MIKKIRKWRDKFSGGYAVEYVDEGDYYYGDGPYGSERTTFFGDYTLKLSNPNIIKLSYCGSNLYSMVYAKKIISNKDIFINISGPYSIRLDVSKIIAIDSEKFKIQFRTAFAQNSWFRFSEEAFYRVLEKGGIEV